jgi:hypothetical protein
MALMSIMWRMSALAVSVLILSSSVPALQALDDDLDRQKALRDIADQKVEARVEETMAEAEKTSKASPTVAIKQLKDLLLTVDLTSDISSEMRSKLAKRISDRISQLEGKPATPKPVLKFQGVKAEHRKIIEAWTLEAKEVREGIKAVEKLYTENKFAEARLKVA